MINNKGYAATCSKCNSTNIKINYIKTTFNMSNRETSTPVICFDCVYVTTESAISKKRSDNE